MRGSGIFAGVADTVSVPGRMHPSWECYCETFFSRRVRRIKWGTCSVPTRETRMTAISFVYMWASTGKGTLTHVGKFSRGGVEVQFGLNIGVGIYDGERCLHDKKEGWEWFSSFLLLFFYSRRKEWGGRKKRKKKKTKGRLWKPIILNFKYDSLATW